MKRAIMPGVAVLLAVQLSAQERDPLDRYLWEIGEWFGRKPYDAGERTLVERDLAMPRELMEPLSLAELSYLQLLRHEIAARHGQRFKEPRLQKIFGRAAWYRVARGRCPGDLNDVERQNISYIRGIENRILLRGEREIAGWEGEEDSQRLVDRAEVTVIDASPAIVRPGGTVAVRIMVRNTGSNEWTPVGRTRQQETGKYYLSSSWVRPPGVRDYVIMDQLPLPGAVAPGEIVTIADTLLAPLQPGRYAVVFSMLRSMCHRFHGSHLPSVEYEFSCCPHVDITVSNDAPSRGNN